MTRSKINAHHWYMRKVAPRTNKKRAVTFWDRRGPKMVSRGSLGEPKWVPKGTLWSKEAPRWTFAAPEGANGNVSHPFVRPRGAQGDPRRAQRGAKGSPEGAKGAQRTPKGAVWSPFWATRAPFEIHCFIVIAGTFRAGEGRQGNPNDGRRGLRRRYWSLQVEQKTKWKTERTKELPRRKH